MLLRYPLIQWDRAGLLILPPHLRSLPVVVTGQPTVVAMYNMSSSSVTGTCPACQTVMSSETHCSPGGKVLGWFITLLVLYCFGLTCGMYALRSLLTELLFGMFVIYSHVRVRWVAAHSSTRIHFSYVTHRPLCWIPWVIPSCYNQEHRCSRCGASLGVPRASGKCTPGSVTVRTYRAVARLSIVGGKEGAIENIFKLIIKLLIYSYSFLDHWKLQYNFSKYCTAYKGM